MLCFRVDLCHIKSGEQTKTKQYHCFCVAAIGDNDLPALSEKIASLEKMEPFVIQQRTPMRVLHRRPLAIRPRTIHWVRGNLSYSGEKLELELFFRVSLKKYFSTIL